MTIAVAAMNCDELPMLTQQAAVLGDVGFVNPTADELDAFNKTMESFGPTKKPSFAEYHKVAKGVAKCDLLGTWKLKGQGSVLSPWKWLACLVHTQTVDLTQVRLLHDALSDYVIGSHDQDGAPGRSVKTVTDTFYHVLEEILKDPPTMNLQKFNTSAQRFKAQIRTIVGLLLRENMAREMSIKDMEAKIQGAYEKKLKDLENKLTNMTNTMMMKRQNPTQQPGRDTKRPKNQDKRFICTKWMKNSCQDANCRDDHFGDLKTMTFLNKHYGLGLKDDDLKKLAQK